ncbi:MAG TPA: ribonuclease III, partial [Thermoanaerobaculia bacterium]|nr:ribonuclease III [Thermoanaerobaculia bacterium]
MPFGRRDPNPLEKRLGYRFKRLDLLELALTHRSWANEQSSPEHYERLEFLGDAVLGVVTAAWLYEQHPELPEGELSKLKAQIVSKTTLAKYAEELELGPALRIGVGEDRSGGRTKPSLLADSLEAVFGALYLDGGLEAARKAILDMVEGAYFEQVQQPVTDPKTQLQEVVQALGW